MMKRLLTTLVMAILMTAAAHAREGTAEAVFAGGCFWCMEAAFQDREGVLDVVSGFTGGELRNPTYDGNHEGHYESIIVTYRPGVIDYQQLLDIYWHNVDPFDAGGQFCDRGHSYKAAIFVTDEQRAAAETSREEVDRRFPDQEVVTRILPASRFWPVKEYHQDYYRKNPLRYKFYKWNCGRAQRLEEIWGDAAGH